jgi:hypothetical protein
MQHRFASTTFLITGGLLAWIAAFAFAYTFAAVACARGFAHVEVMGLPIIPVATIVASLFAAIVNMRLLRQGYRRLKSPDADEHTRFIGFVALAGSGLGLIALLLLVLPALLMKACPAV